MSPKDQNGRVALITGAGSGLGASLAQALGTAGTKLVVNNREGPPGGSTAEDVASALRRQDFEAVSNADSVVDEGAAQRIIDTAIDRFGSLDILILNAGISGTAARVEDMDLADLSDVMEVNFAANVALIKAALPHLRKSTSGRILLISSTAGLHGMRGRAHYSASKAALTAFALSLADEQRRHAIGVNVLMPYAATGMTDGIDPADRERISPARVAPAALWLTSDACTASGEIWIAGAGVYRRASIQETNGIFLADASAAQLGAESAAIADLAGARSFIGGEAAFRGLMDFAEQEQTRFR